MSELTKDAKKIKAAVAIIKKAHFFESEKGFREKKPKIIGVKMSPSEPPPDRAPL